MRDSRRAEITFPDLLENAPAGDALGMRSRAAWQDVVRVMLGGGPGLPREPVAGAEE